MVAERITWKDQLLVAILKDLASMERNTAQQRHFLTAADQLEKGRRLTDDAAAEIYDRVLLAFGGIMQGGI